MDENFFLENLRLKATDNLRISDIKSALKKFKLENLQKRPGDYYPAELGVVLKMAGKIADQTKRQVKKLEQIDPGPREIMLAEQLHDLFMERIIKLRRKLFSSKNPPFETQEKAISWINEQVEADQIKSREYTYPYSPELEEFEPHIKEKVKQLRAETDAIFDLLVDYVDCNRKQLVFWLFYQLIQPQNSEGLFLSGVKPVPGDNFVMTENGWEPNIPEEGWNSLLEYFAQVENKEIDEIVAESGVNRESLAFWIISQTIEKQYKYSYEMISIPGPVGGVQLYPVDFNRSVLKGSKLEILAIETNEITNLTGFDRHQVCLWVLAGIAPEFYRFRMTYHLTLPAFPNRKKTVEWVVLEIRASDLKFKELKQIYKKIKALPTSKRKLNPTHRRVWEMVKENGGVPEEGVVEFWGDIVRRLNSEKDTGIKTWKAAKIAYRRLVKKNPLLEIKPKQ